MNIKIEHWQDSYSSNWVLVDENGQPIYRQEWMLHKGTRKEAEELAHHFAEELGFTSIEVEYWYKSEKRFKQII